MSMGKQAAKKLAESETLTVGELRAMVRRSLLQGGMSKVNPAFSLAEVCGIYLAALDGREDEETPAAWKPDPYSYRGRMKPTRDVLLMTNILRDCGRSKP